MNIFFPFVDFGDFSDAEKRITQILADQEAFTLQMNSIKCFAGGKTSASSVVYASPDAKGIANMRQLVARLDSAFEGKAMMDKQKRPI